MSFAVRSAITATAELLVVNRGWHTF